jgi:hypothetical protein
MDAITPAERERLTGYLSQSGSQLLETVSSLSPAQLDFKPNPDRWSAAQIVEHLTILEGFLPILIDATLKSPPQQSAWQGRDDALIQDIRSRESRVQAPERAHPTGRFQHEELFRQFEAARKRNIEYAATTNAPLRNFCTPHPVFGQIDCYQWLLSAAAHCERHHAQILEVMASADFPRAAATV